MHAIDRPQLPRLGAFALAAVILAIVVPLLAATRVGDIGLSSGFGSSGAATAPAAGAPSASPTITSWFLNPFAAPIRATLPWSTAIQR